jgi:hypothetical protein
MTRCRPRRGCDANHPRIELLRMKDIYAGKLLPPEMLDQPTSAAAPTGS